MRYVVGPRGVRAMARCGFAALVYRSCGSRRFSRGAPFLCSHSSPIPSISKRARSAFAGGSCPGVRREKPVPRVAGVWWVGCVWLFGSFLVGVLVDDPGAGASAGPGAASSSCNACVTQQVHLGGSRACVVLPAGVARRRIRGGHRPAPRRPPAGSVPALAWVLLSSIGPARSYVKPRGRT